MKRIFLFLFVAIFAFAAEAQDFKFAYFSYGEALKSMPDYELAATNVNKLRNQYDNELKKAEDEFNAKYEDFQPSSTSVRQSCRNCCRRT